LFVRLDVEAVWDCEGEMKKKKKGRQREKLQSDDAQLHRTEMNEDAL
jgi:hypothetical protein